MAGLSEAKIKKRIFRRVSSEVAKHDEVNALSEDRAEKKENSRPNKIKRQRKPNQKIH